MDKITKDLASIDADELKVLDMIDQLSEWRADHRRWNKKQLKAMDHAMGFLMKLLSNIEHHEIGPPAAPTWT